MAAHLCPRLCLRRIADHSLSGVQHNDHSVHHFHYVLSVEERLHR